MKSTHSKNLFRGLTLTKLHEVHSAGTVEGGVTAAVPITCHPDLAPSHYARPFCIHKVPSL